MAESQKGCFFIQKLYNPDSLLRLLGCSCADSQRVNRLAFQTELPRLLHHSTGRSHP